MTRTLTIAEADLHAWVRSLVEKGTAVVGPARDKRGGVEYRPIQSYDEIVREEAPPSLSLKAQFLPPTEPLLSWKRRKEDVEVFPARADFRKKVILCARPCDAAAVSTVDRVMDWDYRDELWFGRREATTIVTVACTGGDDACFCTAVGLSPSTTKGSDILLTPVSSGFSAEILTDKGEALVKESGSLFKEGELTDEVKAVRGAAALKVERNLRMDVEKVRGFLKGNFEHPFWKAAALRCHGCGACAAVCPTCHCFDIVDEPEGIDRGTRRRNWDTCQTAKFTLHGSGHNPRVDQSSRIRQRLMHKFYIYPERFDETLCTGCGRCMRACPGGMDLIDVLRNIDRMGDAEAAAKAGAV